MGSRVPVSFLTATLNCRFNHTFSCYDDEKGKRTCKKSWIKRFQNDQVTEMSKVVGAESWRGRSGFLSLFLFHETERCSSSWDSSFRYFLLWSEERKENILPRSSLDHNCSTCVSVEFYGAGEGRGRKERRKRNREYQVFRSLCKDKSIQGKGGTRAKFLRRMRGERKKNSRRRNDAKTSCRSSLFYLLLSTLPALRTRNTVYGRDTHRLLFFLLYPWSSIGLIFWISMPSFLWYELRSKDEK